LDFIISEKKDKITKNIGKAPMFFAVRPYSYGVIYRKGIKKMLGNVFILGDSYSTFGGYIPEGYSAYYTADGPYYLQKIPELKFNENDVCDVTQTWWYNLVNENGVLIQNNSWSGTTLCNTGYNGKDDSEISFIGRVEKLEKEGFFDKNRIDTVFIFGGTNDSFADSPLGKCMFSHWAKQDLYEVLPGFCYLADKLKHILPDANIYSILNTGLKKEITDGYKLACDNLGIDAIELRDIDKVESHPTVRGMLAIKNQILEYINSKR